MGLAFYEPFLFKAVNRYCEGASSHPQFLSQFFHAQGFFMANNLDGVHLVRR